MPTRSWWRGPVGAGNGGWGDSTLSKLGSWARLYGQPQRGDIVSARNGAYHVGIYVGSNTTVSANRYDVGKNDWPFGPNKKAYYVKYWRYQG